MALMFKLIVSVMLVMGGVGALYWIEQLLNARLS
jgi:hypothetical protein